MVQFLILGNGQCIMGILQTTVTPTYHLMMRFWSIWPWTWSRTRLLTKEFPKMCPKQFLAKIKKIVWMAWLFCMLQFVAGITKEINPRKIHLSSKVTNKKLNLFLWAELFVLSFKNCKVIRFQKNFLMNTFFVKRSSVILQDVYQETSQTKKICVTLPLLLSWNSL